MSQTFAQVVEHVKQLSLDEKEELLELLNGFLIEGTGPKAKVHVVASQFEKETTGKKLDLAEDYQATEEGFGEPVGKEEW